MSEFTGAEGASMQSVWKSGWIWRAAAALLLLSIASASLANDFGGSSTGGPGDPPPTSPPPKCPDPAAPACCCAPDDGGTPNPTPTTGKPVSVFDGHETITHTDLVVNGIFPIQFSRYYESTSTYDSSLGYGWAHSYDFQLHEYADESVVVRTGSGRRDRFLFSGGAYVTPTGARSALTQDGSTGRFTLRYPNGQKAIFDVEGRLEALADAFGNRHELLYDPRGKLPLTGISPHALDPSAPMTVAWVYRITRIRERAADGTLTGRYIDLSYDEATGRLTGIASHDGRSVEYVHDVHPGTGLTIGNLVQANGLEGIVHSFVYDDRGAQGQLQDPHNVTSIQLGQGATPWVNTYDSSDRVIRQVHGDGQIDFDRSVPLKTTVTRTIRDHLGQNAVAAVEVYEFDPQGYPVRHVDPLKNERRTTWSSTKFGTREELWQNTGSLANPVLTLLRAEDYGYDAAGNLTSKTVVLDTGETVTKTWTRDHDWIASTQVVSSAAPAKVFRTEYTFFRDGSGVPIAIQEIRRRRDDGSFQTTLFEYNANGQLIATTPASVSPSDGLKFRLTYYTPPEAHPGLLKLESIEVGGAQDPHLTRAFTYDAAGSLESVTDARGHTTTYSNDDLGRVVSMTNALGEQNLYTYAGTTLGVTPANWAPGVNLVEVEVGRTLADGEGQVQRLRRDGMGRVRVVERKDEQGAFSTFKAYEYDSEGNVTREVDALGHTTAYGYDPRRLLVSITDAAASPNLTTFAYDAMGNRVEWVDALGRKTVLVYDDLGRVIENRVHGSASQPVSPPLVTAVHYDAVGNVTKVLDPKGQETIYQYSVLSELLAVTQDLGQTVNYTYDSRGRFIRLTNARGSALVHVYEPWGGLSEVRHYPTAADADAGTNLQRTVSYGFDAAGNVTSVGDTDYNSSTPTLETTTYDALGRTSEATIHYIPGGARTLQHSYDRFGNRKSLVLTDGSDVLAQEWTYDKRGRLVEAVLASPNPFEFEYYANDELETITRDNGVTTAYSYFPEGPVEAITVASPTTQLLDLTYTVDKVRKVTGITEEHAVGGTTHTYAYGYDALDRLASVTYPTALGLPASESFSYDAAGNREDPSDPNAYAYDDNNRITASPGKVWVYDADGNPVSANAGLGSEETFTHDASNRMRGYTSAASSVTSSYLYDPLGRRIKKTVNGVTTWFLWDGNRLLAEFDGSGNRERRYTYLGTYAPAEQAIATGPGTEDIQQVHADHLDAPRALSGDDGEAVWRAAYRAFGLTIPEEDPDGDLDEVDFQFRFPGQRLDAESSLYYNNNRYYDPGSGRYVSADPIGQAGDPNVFSYVRNNPLNSMDPTGLECVVVGRIPIWWSRSSRIDWEDEDWSYYGVRREGGSFPIFWWNYYCKCKVVKTGVKTTTTEITYKVIEMCQTCFGPYFQHSTQMAVDQTQSKVTETDFREFILGQYMIHAKATADCATKCNGP